MPGDVAAPGGRRLALARLVDHAGADGVVGVLVDEDEGAGDAVVGVAVGQHRRARAQRHAADVVELEAGRRGPLVERRHVEPRMHGLDRRAHRARRVLERVARARPQLGVAEPGDGRVELARGDRLAVGRADQVAAADVEVVGEPDRDRERRDGLLERAVVGADLRDRAARAGRHDDHLVAGRERAAGELARVAALVVLAAARADRPLHREAQRVAGRVRAHLHGLEVLEQRRPVVPGRGVRALDDVVAVQRGDRDHGRVGDVEPVGEPAEVRLDLAEALLVSTRRGPSCSRTRRGAGSRAAPRGRRAGATGRRSRCGRRSGSARARRSRRPRPCCACSARGPACRR